jgi:hypothetical protein
VCQVKTYAPNFGAFLPLLFELAGDESAIWHTLFKDFILVAQKLEKLGFKYYNGKVVILEVDG